MNKDKANKKVDYKKSLVRNTVQVKPKAVIIHEPELSDSSLCTKIPTKQQTEVDKSPDQTIKLDSPEFNSALQIARKIESIENIKSRKVKSILDLDKKSSTVVTDKAVKQLNFPYNQPIYKDLIPLCVKTQPLPVASASKEFVIHKEKEPLLSDFFIPKTLPEYSFQVPQQVNNKTVIKQFDGLKLYRTIRNWN